jgi:thiol-disulfide isomerase/thioredoxin
MTASFMLSQNDQAAYDKYRDGILKTAQEIEADPAVDRENKMLAVMYRYRTQIHPIENESELHVLFDKMIGEMKKGYKAAANVQEKYDDKMGYLLAIRMSLDKNKPELAKKYVKQALVEFPDNESFLRIQKMLNKPTFSGKPFEAELTLLDGKKLKLPDDMKGKVVVVDFWASWCGPCRQFAKELKKFYDKYKDKGVEVIGINIDTDKGDMESYLKEHPDYTWKQAYTGLGWQDPTAQKYGINAIPSVWVIGKDGNVVSDNARGDLEGIVEKALNADIK